MFCVIFILRVKAEKMFCKYSISTKKLNTNKRPENQFVQFWKDVFTCFELQWWRLTWHSHPHSVCSSTSTSAQILSHLLLWIVHCANKTWKRDEMHYWTKRPHLKTIMPEGFHIIINIFWCNRIHRIYFIIHLRWNCN